MKIKCSFCKKKGKVITNPQKDTIEFKRGWSIGASVNDTHRCYCSQLCRDKGISIVSNEYG